MAMQCEGDLERKREMETMEQRSRRLRAVIDEWTAAIDEVREETFDPEYTKLEFDKTLRMPPNKSNRSH